MLPTTLGDLAVLAAVPLVGVAVFDTTLVVVSRQRRGVGILTGGRDHSTHRLLRPLGSPRRVAAVLAFSQAALAGLAYLMFDMSETGVLIASGAYIALGVSLIALFEGPTLAPQSTAQQTAAQPTATAAASLTGASA